MAFPQLLALSQVGSIEQMWPSSVFQLRYLYGDDILGPCANHQEAPPSAAV